MGFLDTWNKIQGIIIGLVVIIIIILMVVGGIWIYNKFQGIKIPGFAEDQECKKKYGPKAFWDIFKQKCYRCPDNTNRNLVATVDAKDACISKCPEGTFEHWISGKCYKCPEGMNRTLAGINDPNACKKPTTCKKLNPNWFQHQLTEKCYSCPKGMHRTLYNIEDDRACTNGCPFGSLSYPLTGDNVKCYKCEDGYNKNLTQLNPTAFNSCINKKTCKQINQNWFESGLSGQCYSCKPGYKMQLLETIDSPRKCRGTCPEGSKEHWGSGICYKCERGTRTVFDLMGDRACLDKKTCKDLNGPSSFEHNISGKCYKCPEGTNRTIFGVEGNRACLSNKSCKALNSSHSRSDQMTEDIITGNCFYCPQGSTRLALAPLKCRTAKSCRDLSPGSFEHLLGGECYKCPTITDKKGEKQDSVRTVFGISSDRACVVNHYNPGDLLKIIPSSQDYYKAVKVGDLIIDAVGSSGDKSVKNRFNSVVDDPNLKHRFSKATITANIYDNAHKEESRNRPSVVVQEVKHSSATLETSLIGEAINVPPGIHFNSIEAGSLDEKFSGYNVEKDINLLNSIERGL